MCGAARNKQIVRNAASTSRAPTVGVKIHHCAARCRHPLTTAIHRSPGKTSRGTILHRLRVRTGDPITFAWAGPAERGKQHYYSVIGPQFMIEYDNTQNDGNHIHSVLRDFERDWGEDLLSLHYSESEHH